MAERKPTSEKGDKTESKKELQFASNHLIEEDYEVPSDEEGPSKFVGSHPNFLGRGSGKAKNQSVSRLLFMDSGNPFRIKFLYKRTPSKDFGHEKNNLHLQKHKSKRHRARTKSIQIKGPHISFFVGSLNYERRMLSPIRQALITMHKETEKEMFKKIRFKSFSLGRRHLGDTPTTGKTLKSPMTFPRLSQNNFNVESPRTPTFAQKSPEFI